MLFIFRRGEEHPVPGDGQDAAGLHRAPPVPETRHATASARTLILLDATAKQDAETAVVTLIDITMPMSGGCKMTQCDH